MPDFADLARGNFSPFHSWSAFNTARFPTRSRHFSDAEVTSRQVQIELTHQSFSLRSKGRASGRPIHEVRGGFKNVVMPELQMLGDLTLLKAMATVGTNGGDAITMVGALV